MASLQHKLAALLVLTGVCGPTQGWARQNIVIGEISLGYDFQERQYDDSDGDTMPGKTVTAGEGETTEQATPPAVLSRNEIDEGDARSLFVTPRIRFSSRDIYDLFECTYAPTFAYDGVDSSSDVGHDGKLLGERRLTKDWLVRLTDSYFYGQDSQTDSARHGGVIVAEGTPQPTDSKEETAQEQTPGQTLTDKYGRHRYWRNEASLHTDYTYARDSIVGVGYTFGVLRNVSDTGRGYDDYDRHQASGNLSYRFSNQWSAQTELAYVRGLYDKTEAVKPAPVDEVASDAVASASPAATPLDDDLVEYRGQGRLNYAWNPRDLLFGQYGYAAVQYDADLREDSAIHEATLGWEHAFSRHLRMTLSGGPTLVTYEESDNETGYNAAAGLTWDFLHASLSARTSYRYDYENFDGQRSGLSKIWYSQLGYTYRFSPQWQAALSAGYTQKESEEPLVSQILADATTTASPPERAGEHFSYREETYDAGLTLHYTFLRWYSASLSYRYADFRSEQDQDYDEHRVMLTLAAAKEIFRW